MTPLRYPAIVHIIQREKKEKERSKRRRRGTTAKDLDQI